MRYNYFYILIITLALHGFDEHCPQETTRSKEIIDYVKSKYEHTLYDQEYLFFPAKNPKRLWILFCGAQKNRYTMWSWFWNDNEDWQDTAYLFLKDESFSWYLGFEDKPLVETYTALIKKIINECNLEPKNVFSIGHSMGGYAALFYGITLGFKGIFAFRPQIDWPNAATFFSVNQLKNRWIDINELLINKTAIPLIYLQFGEFEPDKQAGYKLIDTLKSRESLSIIQKTTNTQHIGHEPTKKFIESTLLYFENI